MSPNMPVRCRRQWNWFLIFLPHCFRRRELREKRGSYNPCNARQNHQGSNPGGHIFWINPLPKYLSCLSIRSCFHFHKSWNVRDRHCEPRNSFVGKKTAVSPARPHDLLTTMYTPIPVTIIAVTATRFKDSSNNSQASILATGGTR